MSTAEIPPIDAELVAEPEAFRRLVVEPCQPVVIRGLTSDWPVTRAANTSPRAAADYLLRFDAGRQAEAFVGEAAIGGRYTYGEGQDGFNFTREPIGLAAALGRIVEEAGERTVYVGSLPTDAYLPGFAADNPAPWLPPGGKPRIWIGHASTVACHHDNSDNLACVTAGRRRFTLYPPDAIGDLYVGPIDHTMAGQPVSLAAGALADDPAYPRFAEARTRALSAELTPGDAIYIPKLWWHQVEARGAFNVLVNFWWDAFAGSDAPYTTMLLAAAAIAERPVAERAAWRAFFDHYVFRGDGHPLAHLPPERHGVLARGAAGKLRAVAMRLLRG